jgi:asparagine synthase (glutamine-hydrolysing)
MCGISGYAGGFDLELLKRMQAALRHRGPDDSGLWQSNDRRVGLAHNRLAIIDLSPTGHQPMCDPSNGVVVVYNGEIYNYRELRRDLEARDHRFVGSSDTEVLLKAYAEFGLDAVPRLNGIFAFALFDPREARLLLVRDPFGVKPLYVANAPAGLLFASEMKALLESPEVSRKIDPLAIARYLTFLWSPGEATPLDSVRKLSPGHAQIVERDGSSRLHQYFRISFPRQALPVSDEALVHATRERLATGVKRQMVSDVPVGAFLSGGLDSSAVVACAVGAGVADRLDCFTIVPKHTNGSDEGVEQDWPYAQRVASTLGVRLHAVDVDTEIVKRLPQAIYHLDEPQADPAAINVLLIAELARRHGIKVLLSGTAGDDVFSGYRRHAAYMREGLWDWLPKPFRRGVAAASTRLPASLPFTRRLRKAFAYADLDGDARLVSYFYWLAPSAVRDLMQPDMRYASDRIAAPLLDELASHEPPLRGINRILSLEQRFFLTDHNLAYTDKLSMASGVEVRVPFLDPDLALFANSLPGHLKQRGDQGKWILKRAVEGLLPADVIHRPKTGFGAPLRQWLKGALAPWSDELLSPDVIERRGIFDSERVRLLIAADRAGRVDAAYSIYALLSLEIWFRTFIDSPTPQVVA